MIFTQSLRLRLLVLILCPLIVVAALSVGWQYRQSAASSEVVFDQKLSILALAIYRDLIATQGENLSPSTKALFEEASGSSFFYHVSGPDGGFVTGYSPPPVLARSLKDGFEGLRSFDSTHRGTPVKVVQLRQVATIDQLSGQVVVSVWQNLSERDAFARGLALRGAVVALLLILTVAVVVFFGIRIGLRPLSALESALERRSSADLSPIMRTVPQEVSHIVKRLNDLFAEVTKAQSQKDRFISNAAHQLRNPVAAIASMAEVAAQAKTLKDARARNASLHAVSQDLSRLTEQMLSFERLKYQEIRKEVVSFEDYMQQVSSAVVAKYRDSGVEMSFALSSTPQQVALDPVMIEQALVNLVDNALRHGGASLSEITLSSHIEEGGVMMAVANNGAAIKADDVSALFERFVQGQEGKGSGLGLAIVQQVAHQHHGTLSYEAKEGWVTFIIRLPIDQALADKADRFALDNR